MSMNLSKQAAGALAFSPFVNPWSFGPYYSMVPTMRVSEAALDTDFERALEKQHKLAQRMFDQTTMIPHIASQQHNRYELIDNDEKFQLKVAVPGIKDEDIDIKLEEGFITIQGHHEATTKNSRYSSKFEQTFSLDPAVDVKKFVATIDNGVLVVSAPKEQAKLAEKKGSQDSYHAWYKEQRRIGDRKRGNPCRNCRGRKRGGYGSRQRELKSQKEEIIVDKQIYEHHHQKKETQTNDT